MWARSGVAQGENEEWVGKYSINLEEVDKKSITDPNETGKEPVLGYLPAHVVKT